ncbi:MAG: YdiU family protein [Verrucomicrobia bacterium]|nr:YdiU family protein [Verrucomicrobiota bacterium]
MGPSQSGDAQLGWRLEHTYAQLPGALHVAVAPTPVRAPRMLVFNRRLAMELGLEGERLAGPEGAQIFSGNSLPPGASPLAQAYAGHQFGHFATLGDGRAILLGEHITPRGERFDVQLKGAGPTPFSRRGDGRATLGAMLREYIISEAMHALGLPTTRSLAVAGTGEEVWRQDGARPGAVLTRVAASHIRVGTFAWVAARRDEELLAALVDYTVKRHYPELAAAKNRALALFEAVAERQAALIARWMHVGFVHGVMNTDNMALSGETIDYGPCAFIDAYDPATVFSSIDAHGRYAFGNQARIAQWNLARLAEALLPLIDPVEAVAVERANEAIARFGQRFQWHWLTGMRRKLALEVADAGFADWKASWRARLTRQAHGAEDVMRLRRANCPAVIPRNHQVEAALAAAEQGDLSVMERLLAVLAAPYDYGVVAAYREPAPNGGAGYQTFCGT